MVAQSETLGGKAMAGRPASLGSHKADLRRPITAWKALVWAYRDECVAAATNTVPDRRLTDFATAPMDRERLDGGLIHGQLDAHPDAVVIDAKLRSWFEGRGLWQVRAIQAAEKGVPPARAIDLPEARPVPLYNRDGTVAMQMRKSNGKWQPHYCLIDWEGEPADVLAAKRRQWGEFLALFDAFLAAMPGFPLTKWRVLT